MSCENRFGWKTERYVVKPLCTPATNVELFFWLVFR